MERIPLSDASASYSAMSKIGAIEIRCRENGDLMIVAERVVS